MNPGSEEARKAGCTCPIMDNNYGKGYLGQPGVFVYRSGCKVHDQSYREIVEENKK